MTFDARSPRRPAASRLTERVEELTALDGPAEAVAGAVRGTLKPGRMKDALSGSWLGPVSYTHLTLPTICSV